MLHVTHVVLWFVFSVKDAGRGDTCGGSRLIFGPLFRFKNCREVGCLEAVTDVVVS